MEEKLENILQKSFSLFVQYGIRSISMDDICKHLGISKKTLYQYVSNKEDLIRGVLDYLLDSNYECGFNNDAENMNAIDVLLNITLSLSSFIKNINPSVVYDLQKYHPEVFKEFVEKKRTRAFDDIKGNFEKGIGEGLYRQDLNIDLVAELYVKRLQDLHDPEFIASTEFTFEKIFEVMFENHIRGISNEKGIAYFEEKKKTLNINL